MSLTKEQILKIKNDLPWHGDVSSLDISELCDLALRGLETQQKPTENKEAELAAAEKRGWNDAIKAAEDVVEIAGWFRHNDDSVRWEDQTLQVDYSANAVHLLVKP